MRYVSTRGQAPELDFRGVLLAGLASDGGLYVPAELPQFSPHEIAAFARLSYPELALAIISPFVGDTFSAKELKMMVQDSYASFTHPAVAPLRQLADDHFLLELFHGPTLSFKDFALQLLGRLLEAALADEKKLALVLGATSGDTGSAAIAGCMDQRHLEIVILYPEGRISDVQRRQMTTTGATNVHAVAVKGTFDDCQALVKAAFADRTLRSQRRLLAVNSINWARVMAQIVYYFYAALALGAPATRVNFCVPTGNFGNVFAGHTASRMGLPVGKFLIATNENDILSRCVTTGEYKTATVHATLSPAMDIQVSSNFERLLFELYGRDGARIAQLMAQLTSSGGFTLSRSVLADLRAHFMAVSIDDKTTLETIKKTFAGSGMLIDPHSAVGVAAAQRAKLAGPVVTLATAHPAKFPEAVNRATGLIPPLPSPMADLYARRENSTSLANDAKALKELLTRL